jgi:UDPglucose 6-dehydrogenase
LHAAGVTVTAYDPIAEPQARTMMTGVTFARSALDAVKDADACVIVTEWPEFSQLDWPQVRRRMAHGLIIDGRNFLDRDILTQAGFTVEGIGTTGPPSFDVPDIETRRRRPEKPDPASALEAA